MSAPAATMRLRPSGASDATDDFDAERVPADPHVFYGFDATGSLSSKSVVTEWRCPRCKLPLRPEVWSACDCAAVVHLTRQPPPRQPPERAGMKPEHNGREAKEMGMSQETKTQRPESGRFDYVKYDDQAAAAQRALKEAFTNAEQLIEAWLRSGRGKALALTSLEESYMWVGKAIRDEQIARNGDATDQPKRGE